MCLKPHSATNRAQDTLKRAVEIIQRVPTRPIRPWFTQDLGVSTWYLRTRVRSLSLGSRLISTIIRLLWICKIYRVDIHPHIPQWNHRMSYIAITVKRLRNQLPRSLGSLWTDHSWSPRGRSRSARPGVGRMGIMEFPPSLGCDYTDYGGLSDYGDDTEVDSDSSITTR